MDETDASSYYKCQLYVTESLVVVVFRERKEESEELYKAPKEIIKR